MFLLNTDLRGKWSNAYATRVALSSSAALMIGLCRAFQPMKFTVTDRA
jgi:hypothetical protein